MVKILISIAKPEEVDIVKGSAIHIVDVKEPARGSLGLPDIAIVKRVVESVSNVYEVSAAIGDLARSSYLIPYTVFALALLSVNYVKAGLEVSSIDEALDIGKRVAEGLSVSSYRSKVVLVGYADHYRVGSIEPLKIIDVAYRSEADGVMIDTRVKDGKNTFQFLEKDYLKNFVYRAKDHNLFTAIAGGLGVEHICRAIELGFDVIGFRGAVCDGGRGGTVSKKKIESIVNEVQRCISRY